MDADLAKVVADFVFLAGAVVAAIKREFAVALVAVGLFLLSLAAALGKV
jgi:hypothetical protein